MEVYIDERPIKIVHSYTYLIDSEMKQYVSGTQQIRERVDALCYHDI